MYTLLKANALSFYSYAQNKYRNNYSFVNSFRKNLASLLRDYFDFQRHIQYHYISARQFKQCTGGSDDDPKNTDYMFSINGSSISHIWLQHSKQKERLNNKG